MEEATTHAERLRRDGFTIVENAIEPGLVAALNEALVRLERELDAKPAGNSFEGARTVRIYNLLAHGAPFDRVPVHGKILPVVEDVLGTDCLVSTFTSMAIDPGETAQPIHADDMVIPLPKPRPPIVCSALVALDDFTAANGATRLVPGSHVRPSPTYGGQYETIPAEMTKGSVLIIDGSLWHGGGANRTDRRRTGIAMNYCAGFIRQQENQLLGVPAGLARRYPARLQALMGYEPYRGLIGHIDKKSPAQILNGKGGFRSIWDR
jgi:ectoine hydroxylase-related dioxygenase (phytanoyl-CoA dioxygenase family)